MRLVQAARQAEPEQALNLFDEALQLWRGPAYEGVRDRPPVAGEARRLDEQRLRAERERAALLLELSRYQSVSPRAGPPSTPLPADPVPRQLPAPPAGFAGRKADR